MHERPNYLHRVPNPWNLAPPPQWFLDEMRAYDAELVIFPSAEEACYRFARRAKVHPAVMQALKNRPDTKTYWEHRLVPVTSLPQFEPWSPRILFELAERDIQRVGGGDAAADILDAHEAQKEQAERITMSDTLDRISKDAYVDFTVDAGTRNARKTRGGIAASAKPRRAVHRPTHWRGNSGAVFAR